MIGGRGKGEVIGVLCRCMWVTCFCILKMELLSMIRGWSFQAVSHQEAIHQTPALAQF